MIELAIFLTLLTLGYVFGRLNERRHYASIQQREEAYRALLLLPGRYVPEQYIQHHSTLVSGNVVVSVDYFKTIAAGLRGLVGGRIASYESLIDRARREAILRMQEEAAALGAEAILNIKMETSRVAGNDRNGLGSVEVLAYGTALFPRR
ncbi:hypothetical protein A167_03058 [Alcanivorax sp. S71-1-4]|jgi:uncharacterized protein YbjQ (UPF0145 family)|uniref:YbjQ family protein n=1 Tax=Alcanivorax sp. S71-1-4 TaxID=1177159 RepID=UPI001359322F|nr:heavy metal-binding domain-containing protein [Alcanivorax sp. S71-1-4]KAF0807011.1 hypothetical protein A167_03058 [Alcanivorax sp. S71-1-4]